RNLSHNPVRLEFHLRVLLSSVVASCGSTNRPARRRDVKYGVPQDDLVERRRRYIQRQIELDKSAVDVRFAGQRPEGSGPANRDGMPRLPVGQHQVKNWPVLDLGEQPEVALDQWKLEVGG